jgi:hypothetical protein
MLLTKERIVSHIPKFGDAASTARDVGSSTGDAGSSTEDAGSSMREVAM